MNEFVMRNPLHRTLALIVTVLFLVFIGFSIVFHMRIVFAVVACLIGAGLLLLFRDLVRSADSRKLLILILIAIIIRIALVLFLHFTNIVEESDALLYHGEALRISRVLLGSSSAGFSVRSNGFGYIYALSVFYAGFGPVSLIPKIINSFAGIACCVYVYKIAFKIWRDEDSALVAAGLAMFFPGILLWSTMNLRDIWVTLFVMISIWHMWSIREKGYNRKDILILVLCFLLLWTFRFYIALLLVPLVIFTVGAGRKRGMVYLSILLVVLVFFFGNFLMNKQIMGVNIGLEEISRRRVSLAEAGDSAVEDTRSVENPIQALMFLPSGLVYLFFYPLPWSAPKSMLYLMAIPEMLLLYLLVPFTLVGIYKAVKKKVIGLEIVFYFIISSAILYALMAANIGTLYRMRMPIFLLLFVFAAGGLMTTRAVFES